MRNGGVVTQVGGDAGGDGFAIFTAANTSSGRDDVDGGLCAATSPVVRVDQESVLSVDWFFGQRDSGDDPNDFFLLEYSVDGGSSFIPLIEIGDVTQNSEWDTATADIPAGSSVVVRVGASDGRGNGDLVEAGVDSVSICAQ